uniref:Ribosome biogenesis protein NOP53 n=1 Tax=Parastrongyloides trichosuri TaxID=131310 RepID=A0A0N4ZQ25_PARTI
MGDNEYLNKVVQYSIKTITAKIRTFRDKKPWKYQKHANRIRKESIDELESICKKTIKVEPKKISKVKTKKVSKEFIPKDETQNGSGGRRRTKKERGDKKGKKMKGDSDDIIKSKPTKKRRITEKLKRIAIESDSNSNTLNDDSKNKDELKNKDEVKVEEKPKFVEEKREYRFSRKDILPSEDDSSDKESEKSEERKRREKALANRKSKLPTPPKNLLHVIDGKDPDDEIMEKLKKLNLPVVVKKGNSKDEDKINLEELAMTYALKYPRSSLGSKILGPYPIETIEEAMKKHPNVKIIENNKNFNGRVMSDNKRPFWHQVDPIPIIMGKGEDTTDDTLPINTEILKNYEEGKIKIENNINLKPKNPNPYGILKDMINQNSMFTNGQIFANTMRAILKFRPKHIKNSIPKVDSLASIQKNAEEKGGKKSLTVNALPETDDTTAEEEVEGSSKRLLRERENKFPILPKTKIVYKRANPRIWKEVPIEKIN